jgi:hypothetical protein
MLKLGLLVMAVTLVGCASTRQERAAAFQRELPQLLAACNGWARAEPRLDGPSRRDGLKACDRLSVRNSLVLADPATVSAYHRTLSGSPSMSAPQTRGTYSVPAPLPQSQ